MTQQSARSKKAVLTNRIFLDTDTENRNRIIQALTYRIPSTNPLIPRPTIIKNYRLITQNIISLPSGREDLIPEETEIIDKRIEKPVDFPKAAYDLRPDQTEAALALSYGTGILNAPVGWGKTFTALHIASMLGQKTLIVVHNLSIRSQWEKEIKRLFGITPGVIGSSKFFIHPIITVANVQTLANHMDRVEAEFGTVILDEAHHVPASTFTTVMDRLKCKYKIGLTGTLQRKDGKHVLFTDYFGDVVVKPKSTNVMYPEVRIVKSKVALPDGNCWADKVTKLLDTPEYIELIAVLTLMHIEEGHKVLVLADRILFQQKVAELIGDRCVIVDGSTSLEDRDKAHAMLVSGEKDALIGTTSIYKEGISESILSCLILSNPVNNEGLLEQLMGRIMRLFPGKLTPVVVDVQLKRTPTSNTAYLQAASRIGTYMKLGYSIKQLLKN